MSKEPAHHIGVYLGIAAAIGIFIGSFLNFTKRPSFSLFSANAKEEKIKRLIQYIEYDYVDNVNTDSILDNTIHHLLENLDPHSVYIPQSELQAIQENMQGSFKGIGIHFRMIHDTLTVLDVIKEGPSDKAGILAGDRILISDKDTLFGKNYTSKDILGFLKGGDRDEAHLIIYRKQTDSILNFNFKRGSVNITSVPVYYMINDSLGYIDIQRFAKNSYDEFHTALTDLLQEGMQSLILDLRGNTGGYMDVAEAVADEFLEKGKLIVFTKDRRNRIVKSFATAKGDFEKGKLYVFIDEESASASEIVAGALQDNDKGIIIGRRSFGKGLVQQEMALGDGSAVRLTTARYYTPTGRSIQKPYDHKGSKNYYHDIERRTSNGELLFKDSIHVADSLRFTTPKGKIVYGGGGIIPDVFVPLDTTRYFPKYHLIGITDFVFTYIDKNRKKYSKISWQEFNKQFDTKAILKSYLKKAQNVISTPISHPERIETYLKALAARELFGEKGFYRVYEKEDKYIRKVLELEKTHTD